MWILWWRRNATSMKINAFLFSFMQVTETWNSQLFDFFFFSFQSFYEWQSSLGPLRRREKSNFWWETADVGQIIAISWLGRESCSQYRQKSELAHCGTLTQPPSFFSTSPKHHEVQDAKLFKVIHVKQLCACVFWLNNILLKTGIAIGALRAKLGKMCLVCSWNSFICRPPSGMVSMCLFLRKNELKSVKYPEEKPKLGNL